MHYCASLWCQQCVTIYTSFDKPQVRNSGTEKNHTSDVMARLNSMPEPVPIFFLKSFQQWLAGIMSGLNRAVPRTGYT
jgi:hypothetical protein